jgi:hypothetical protein
MGNGIPPKFTALSRFAYQSREVFSGGKEQLRAPPRLVTVKTGSGGGKNSSFTGSVSSPLTDGDLFLIRDNSAGREEKHGLLAGEPGVRPSSGL